LSRLIYLLKSLKYLIEIESDELDIFAPHYIVEVTVRVRSKANETKDYSETKSIRITEATANDVEELDKRIDQNIQHIKTRNESNKRARDAYSLLKQIQHSQVTNN
jgi:glutamine synthetase type III